MNFNELCESLPNGFHDTEVRRYEMNYEQRTLTFDLYVWVAKTEAEHARELCRPARVTINNVCLLIVQAPDARLPWTTSATIDTFEGLPKVNPPELPALPEGTSITSMELVHMGACLIFGGGSASLEWTGPEENYAGSAKAR